MGDLRGQATVSLFDKSKIPLTYSYDVISVLSDWLRYTRRTERSGIQRCAIWRQRLFLSFCWLGESDRIEWVVRATAATATSAVPFPIFIKFNLSRALVNAHT